MHRKRLIEELLNLIEYNDVAWRKAAFYSDPQVEPIYNRLVEEWEKAGGEGIPLDYASVEELEVLVRAARKYAFMPESRARALALARMGGGEEEAGSLGVFSRIVSWIRRRD